MLLKNFIILLLYTWTTDLQVARGLKSCHATQTAKGRIKELEENLKNKKVGVFEESSEQIASEYALKNSTELIRAYDALGSGYAHNKAPERSYHEFNIATQPEVSFAEEPQTFNIIEQLKLDEIRDVQSELVFNQGQVKASKKKKKKRKKKPNGDEATVLYTQLTTMRPHYYYPKWTTTKKPKKIALKKKKKEYLNHLKEVLYPFVKFIAFFTVLNPFTIKVFLFTLISPVVFGFLGFMALSLLVKPTLHLIFDVKKHVNQIKAKKWRERKRHERLHRNRRPITIHKHYYKNVVLPQTPETKWRPQPLPHSNWPEWLRAEKIDFKPKPQQPVRKEIRKPSPLTPTKLHFNPILPNVAEELEDWHYGPTQLNRFKVRKPANLITHTRQPTFRDHIPRPLSSAFKRHRSPVRFKEKSSAAPLRSSAEIIEPPFL